MDALHLGAHYELLMAMTDAGHPLARPSVDETEARVQAALPILRGALKDERDTPCQQHGSLLPLEL